MLRNRLILLIAYICGAVNVATPLAASQQPDLSGRFLAYAGDGAEPRISNFSGLPVPRYSSLRNAPANGRAGPSQDYPVRWQYQVEGLPVIIIRETEDWRKVRDPQGDEVWMHRSLISGEHTVITMYEGVLRKDPDEMATAIARYPSGLVMFLKEECSGAWCRVGVGDRDGWAPRRQLWGSDLLPGASN